MKSTKASPWDREKKLNETFFFRLTNKDLNRFRRFAKRLGLAPSTAARQVILERLENEVASES